MAKKNSLGMGLDALFPLNETEGTRSQTLRITEISPNKAQPRRDFDDAALEALADSIKKHGVLQPILVRPLPTGGYQIVAGERRWRAARMAGLDEMPVYIRELDDDRAAQLALVENLQRDDVARVVGKSRSAVANSLRLLSLDKKTIESVRKGDISAGHARALVGITDKDLLESLAQRIKRGELTVRQTEELAKTAPKKQQPKQPKLRESIYHEVELSLRETSGRVCTVKENKTGGGVFSVEFYDRDDLMRIARLLESVGKNGG